MANLDETRVFTFIRNNGRIYLTSDNADLTSTQNGYYIQLGESGSTDALRLFKMESGTSSLLCSGADGQIASSFEVGIKVVRTASGDWTLYADLTGGNQLYISGKCE